MALSCVAPHFAFPRRHSSSHVSRALRRRPGSNRPRQRESRRNSATLNSGRCRRPLGTRRQLPLRQLRLERDHRAGPWFRRSKPGTSRGRVCLSIGPAELSYIAALEPRMAFIIDVRRQNLVEHLMYRHCSSWPTIAATSYRVCFAKAAGDVSSHATDEELLLAFERSSARRAVFRVEPASRFSTRSLGAMARRTGRRRRQEPHVGIQHVLREGPRLKLPDWRRAKLDMPTYIDLMTQSGANGQRHSFLSASATTTSSGRSR